MPGDISGLAVRIRGMYATAVTSILMERGVEIVDPSPAIQARFGLATTNRPADVLISDRRDSQGVLLRGPMANVLRTAMIHILPRSVVRPETSSPESGPAWSAEFPAQVKERLDQVRSGVIPTIPGHHHLKIIDSDKVDEAERTLAKYPNRVDELVRRLRHDLIDRHFKRGVKVVVEHVKPAGQVYHLRGRLSEYDGRHVRLHRNFYPGGAYDSLDVPRLDGDFGHLELEEGSGISLRSYRRRDGALLGELYNLATPAELYPAAVRYVDLELDVLRTPANPAHLIDEDDFERAIELGFLQEPLISDAWALADEVMAKLRTGAA